MTICSISLVGFEKSKSLKSFIGLASKLNSPLEKLYIIS
nr:MAG TPA: hypothetical protein [Caudoviricetes sp.]